MVVCEVVGVVVCEVVGVEVKEEVGVVVCEVVGVVVTEVVGVVVLVDVMDVVCDVVMLVVAELVTEVVGVEVIEVVGVVVGVVISHCAKVPSRKESSASFKVAATSGHIVLGTRRYPPAVQTAEDVVSPRVYSVTRALIALLTSLQLAPSSAREKSLPSLGSLQVMLPIGGGELEVSWHC